MKELIPVGVIQKWGTKYCLVSNYSNGSTLKFKRNPKIKISRKEVLGYVAFIQNNGVITIKREGK